jgi:hypothetical protein
MTVRIWSRADGKLLQTIRVPAGPDNVGKSMHSLSLPGLDQSERSGIDQYLRELLGHLNAMPSDLPIN